MGSGGHNQSTQAGKLAANTGKGAEKPQKRRRSISLLRWKTFFRPTVLGGDGSSLEDHHPACQTKLLSQKGSSLWPRGRPSHSPTGHAFQNPKNAADSSWTQPFVSDGKCLESSGMRAELWPRRLLSAVVLTLQIGIDFPTVHQQQLWDQFQQQRC